MQPGRGHRLDAGCAGKLKRDRLAESASDPREGIVPGQIFESQASDALYRRSGRLLRAGEKRDRGNNNQGPSSASIHAAPGLAVALTPEVREWKRMPALR